MKIKKFRKPGQCDAMRCMNAPGDVREDGVKLCEKHAGETYSASVPAPVKGSYDLELVPPRETVDEAMAPAAELVAEFEPILQHPAFVVKDQERANTVGEHLSEVKRLIKELEAQRKSVTAPMNAALKTVNGWFKPTVQGLQRVEAVLKGKLVQFLEEGQAARVLALQAGDTSVPEPLPPEGVQARRLIDVEVVDIDAVDERFLKPREVDEAAVRAAFDADETAEFAGLAVRYSYSIAVAS